MIPYFYKSIFHVKKEGTTMKKSISLLLTLALCLSLCACSIGDFVTIEIHGFGDSADHSGDSVSSNDSYEETYANHVLFPFIYGTWNLKNMDEAKYNPYTSVTINEDGTCVVDGEAGTWTISFWTDDNDLSLEFYINGEHTCGAMLSVYGVSPSFYALDSNNGICMGLWENEAEVPADHNDIVLTVDNWRDFFELRAGEEFVDDAFGDLERIHLYQYMVLKEEYADKVLIADVAFEMVVTGQKTNISVNPEARSYSLGEVVEDVERDPEIRYLDHELSVSVFGNNYINIKDHLDPDSRNGKTVTWIPSLEAIVMLRIKGTIYIKND